jgi:DMSO/TMAO reductase YedYZ molybdopterin-dependent catalytic subunit
VATAAVRHRTTRCTDQREPDRIQLLEPSYVTSGVDLGHVRRPLPVQNALKDVLLAYEMNGETLPPDHGFPVRVIAPSWAGISSIKWLGRIEVSRAPLISAWNTQYYRLFGPDYPADGTLISRQVIKSAFELLWDGTLAAGHKHLIRGRSWSGNGPIRHVEVSTDGETWRGGAPVRSVPRPATAGNAGNCPGDRPPPAHTPCAPASPT